MLDFYGRKKQSIEMQKKGEIKHVKKADKQWIQIQKNRLEKRKRRQAVGSSE